MKTISQRIKEGMQIRDLRQIDLVNITGISKGALSSYISGKYVPKQNNIYLISKALGVNEAWLLGYDVPMDKEYGKYETHMLTAMAKQENSPFFKDFKRDELIKNIDIENIDIELINRFKKLNHDGKNEALKRIDELTFIPKYVQEQKVYVAAAHERTDIKTTKEMHEYDDDIMTNDKEWE